MKKWNKLIRFGLLGVAVFGLAACGKGATSETGASASDKKELEVIKIEIT